METIAALRPLFLSGSFKAGFPDFDAAALKSAFPRTLTQSVASYLYGLSAKDGNILIDGVCFASRHGDDLRLWAIFEHPGDNPSSKKIQRASAPRLVDVAEPDLKCAMDLHGLVWAKS